MVPENASQWKIEFVSALWENETMVHLYPAFVLCLLAYTLPVFAAPDPVPQCRKEAQRICGPKIQSWKRIKGCIDANYPKMNSLCADEIKAMYPCPSEIKTVCKDYNGFEVTECFEKKQKSFSAACEKQIRNHLEQKPCFKETQTFCKNVPESEERFCLAKVYDKLSPKCIAARYSKKIACLPDFRKFCGNAKTKGAIADCFLNNWNALSKTCVQHVASLECSTDAMNFCKTSRLEGPRCVSVPRVREGLRQCLMAQP